MKRASDPRRIEVVQRPIAEILRRKTPAERVAMIFDANETMRLLIEGPLRANHPHWTDAQIRDAVARRMLGETV